MRRRFGFLVLLVLVCPLVSWGQTVRTFTLNSATQVGPHIDLRGTGVFVHTFTWSTNNTVSAGACALQGSADNVTFGTTIIAAETVTSSGGPATSATSNANWVRINCTTPIAGAGNVQFRYSGSASGGTGADVNVTNPSIPVTGTVTVTNPGGTQDADDASIAAGQTTSITLGLNQLYNGAAWVRQTGDATNGLDVDVTRVGGTVTVAGTVALGAGSAAIGHVITDPTSVTTATLSAETTKQIGVVRLANGAGSQLLTSSTAGGTVPLDIIIRDTLGNALTNLGGGTQYAQGDVAIVGAIGTGATGVRRDTPAVAAGVGDGDYMLPSFNSVGGMWISPTGAVLANSLSIRCVNAANNAFEGCGSSGTTDTDDGTIAGGQTVGVNASVLYWFNGSNDVRAAVGAPIPTRASDGTNYIVDAAEGDAVSSSPVPIGGVYRTSPVTLNAGDVGYPRVDVNAHLIAVGAAGDGVAVSGSPNRIGGKDGSGNTQDILTDTSGNLLVTGVTAPVVTMNSASANTGVTSANAFVYDDVAPTAITENSFGFARMSANRVPYLTIRDAAGNERGANVTASNELSVNCGNCTGTTPAFADDGAFGVASDDVVAIGAMYDATPDSVDDGDIGIFRMTIDRVLLTSTTVTSITAGDTDIGNVDLEFAGTAAATSNGGVSAQTLRVAVANDNSAITTWGHAVEDDAETAGGILLRAGGVRRDTAASSAGTAGDNATLNLDALGRLWVRDGGPCADHARLTTAKIEETTGAINEIVALNGSDLIYICAYKWVTTAASDLQWVYGTGTDCATGTTDVEGPQPFGANGGVVEAGGGQPLAIIPAGNALCLQSSAATAHGGRVTFVRTAVP